MKRFFVCCACGLIVFLLTGILGVSIASENELQKGEDLFAGKCQICHGPDGRGDGPAANAFNPKPANFTSPSFWEYDAKEKMTVEEKITKAVTKGKGQMPAFNFSPEEIKAIIDYLEHAFKK